MERVGTKQPPRSRSFQHPDGSLLGKTTGVIPSVKKELWEHQSLEMRICPCGRSLQRALLEPYMKRRLLVSHTADFSDTVRTERVLL